MVSNVVSNGDCLALWPGSTRYELVRHLIEPATVRVVSLCKDTTTGALVVTKCVDRWGNREERMMQEIRVLQQLSKTPSCQGAMRLLGAYSDDRRAYLVEEWASSGDLLQHLETESNRNGAWALREQHAARLFVGILEAVESLHKHGIAHLDISIENIVFREDGTAALTDFEFAVPTPAGTVGPAYGIRRVPSKRGYLAPEAGDAREFQCEPVDMFACGVILFMLLFGDPPPWAEAGACSSASWASLRKAEQLPLRDGLAEPLSEQALALLDALLAACPDDRPTATTARQHAFFDILEPTRLAATSCRVLSAPGPSANHFDIELMAA